VVIGVAGVAGIALGAGSSPAATGPCLPPVISCPTTTTTSTTAAPQATITGVTDIRDTSAVFTAEINPGGLTTSYSWGYMINTYGGTFEPLPHNYVLGPSSSPVQIQTRIKLMPGAEYSQLVLSAVNADGNTQAHWQPTFRTPEHPRLKLVLRTNYTNFGTGPPVTARVSGTYNSLAALKFYIAPYPFTRWREADGGEMARTYGHSSVMAHPCLTDVVLTCGGMERNFKLKATLGPGTSPTRLIYVFPNYFVSSEREKDGDSPWIDVTFSATVHAMHRYPRQRVYFYASPSRRGPYSRIGSARFHVAARSGDEGTTLHATVRVNSPRSVYLLGCIKHQLVSDMGHPFNNRKCGRPRL
jgi:hypothetical protein